MLVSSRAIVVMLAAAHVNAVVVPLTVSAPVYVTTTVQDILLRQGAGTSTFRPSAGALSGLKSPSPTGSAAVSTRVLTTTLATTEIVTGTLTATTPGQITTLLGNTTWAEWLTTSISSYWSNSLSYKTCDQTATCTNANYTKDANGKLVIPVPIPILVIINNVVPQAGRPPKSVPQNDPDENEDPKSQDKPSSKARSSAETPSTASKVSRSSVTSLARSSSLSSSMKSSSSSFNSITTSFSFSKTSTNTVSSSTSANSTSAAGPSCPTGSALELDDDEGDNENPDAGAFCPRLSLALNDEEDFAIGDWLDSWNSSNIPIPVISFKPSSSSKQPAVPTLSHETSSKQIVAPTLPTSANRPNETPSSTPKPKPPASYKCTDIRPYAGPNAKKDCEKDEYCKTFEWWGPIGKDPLLKLPFILPLENNSWDGFERTCEPYKESPTSYYCKSCTRNPEVCKITRWYNINNFGSAKSPIEECWTDEMCESDREHTRICHERNPLPNLQVYQDSAFCMECPRNTPVEPDSEGCFAQMDFKDDGRQDFPPYIDHSYHECKRYCISDDYAKRYCQLDECFVCPH